SEQRAASSEQRAASSEQRAASSEQRAASSEQRAASIPDGSLKRAKNLAICLTLSGTKGFSVLMVDVLPDNHMVGDTQCFPLFLYGAAEDEA
ncbi:type ISP restriction/modification enzyme, partial [Xanthomonas hortorum]